MVRADQQYREASAKLLATLLLTLRGTVYIYQGDEIGMTNVAYDSIDDYDDVEIVARGKMRFVRARIWMSF